MPVLEDAAQAAGSTGARRAARRARHGRHVLLLPLQEPRLLRRRRHRSRPRDDGRRRAGAHAALPRLPRQGHLRAGRLQLAPGRAPGGDPARAAAPPRRLGRRAPARQPRTTSDAGLGELVDAARARSTGSSPAWHLYVVAPPEVERAGSALPRADIGHKAYYRTPVHRQPRDARRGARASSCPATEQAARSHLAIPMSPVLSAEQADEVVARPLRRAARAASRSAADGR